MLWSSTINVKTFCTSTVFFTYVLHHSENHNYRPTYRCQREIDFHFQIVRPLGELCSWDCNLKKYFLSGKLRSSNPLIRRTSLQTLGTPPPARDPKPYVPELSSEIRSQLHPPTNCPAPPKHGRSTWPSLQPSKSPPKSGAASTDGAHIVFPTEPESPSSVEPRPEPQCASASEPLEFSGWNV